jgi:predicted transcriptional regulator
MEIKELTRAEEQVMQYLWQLKKGFLKDIVEKFAEPRPAYTTVSTVIRVLVRKGFIGFSAHGKVHEYYPLIAKEKYFQTRVRSMIHSFFDGSVHEFASYFAREKMTLTELEEIKKLIEEKIKLIKSNR